MQGPVGSFGFLGRLPLDLAFADCAFVVMRPMYLVFFLDQYIRKICEIFYGTCINTIAFSSWRGR